MTKVIWDIDNCDYGEPCPMVVPDTSSNSTELELYVKHEFTSRYYTNGTLTFENQDTMKNYTKYWQIWHDNQYIGSNSTTYQFSLPPGDYQVYTNNTVEIMEISVIGTISEAMGNNIIIISIVIGVICVIAVIISIRNERDEKEHKGKSPPRLYIDDLI